MLRTQSSKFVTKPARLTAKTDFGKSYVTTSQPKQDSRKGGAFPILQSQFRHALGCLPNSQRAGTTPAHKETLRQTISAGSLPNSGRQS